MWEIVITAAGHLLMLFLALSGLQLLRHFIATRYFRAEKTDRTVQRVYRHPTGALSDYSQVPFNGKVCSVRKRSEIRNLSEGLTCRASHGLSALASSFETRIKRHPTVNK
jgi:hypothetical protein